MTAALDSLTEARDSLASARLYLIVSHKALDVAGAGDLAEQVAGGVEDVAELHRDVEARIDLIENGPAS